MKASSNKKKKIVGVPAPTVRRMPTYLSYLKETLPEGKQYISAPAIARDLKLDPTQVTKDLSYTGITGKTRIGYDVLNLIDRLEDFLGFNRKNDAFLLGVGNLGKALIGYPGFNDFGVKIVAAFDVNPELVGTEISGVPVFHIDKFRNLAERLHIRFGILTTPAEVAQNMTDLMVAWGIKAIWNFTPVNLRLPEDIILQNTSIYSNLALLLNKIHNFKKT